jgi:hypothetical protein
MLLVCFGEDSLILQDLLDLVEEGLLFVVMV